MIDQIEHSPGNLTLLARAAQASEPKQGLAVGWHAVVRAVGIPPWWLTSPSGPFARLSQVHENPSNLATVSALVLLALLVMVLIAGALRGGEIWPMEPRSACCSAWRSAPSRARPRPGPRWRTRSDTRCGGARRPGCGSG